MIDVPCRISRDSADRQFQDVVYKFFMAYMVYIPICVCEGVRVCVSLCPYNGAD